MKIVPNMGIPGGEVLIESELFEPDDDGLFRVMFDRHWAHVTAASNKRVIALVPEISNDSDSVNVQVGRTVDDVKLAVGKRIASGMHIVANPAVDPTDGAVVVTRSGSRGQFLPNTIYRIEADGHIDEMPDPILNPTGIAFDLDGNMYVSNRADGEVNIVTPGGINSIYASGLGVATGIAFDQNGDLFVGDRAGTIYRISDSGSKERFASIEPSVAAYHLAFAQDGRLFVSIPGFSSHHSIYCIDHNGEVSRFANGFGRPQGLAFDTEGRLYAATCFGGRQGIFRISSDGENIEHIVAGNGIVGLCFTADGKMIVATGDSVYSFDAGIYGTLL